MTASEDLQRAAPESAQSVTAMTGNFGRLGNFARDLIQADVTRGTQALLLAIAGAVFEGAGLMLLVPIIAVLSGDPAGNQAVNAAMTSQLMAYLPGGKTAQLAALIAMFGVLIAMRSITTVARDVTLARLNGEFLERTRIKVLERLVTAGWSRIAGLHHGRITHLLSADFQACGLAGISFINLCLSAIILIVLLLAAFILSPLLAATALFFLLLLAIILYPTLKAARRSGSALVEVSLKLSGDLSQFLAGLKPALGNNLGGELLAHISWLQREQTRQAISFARQQSRSRAVITLAAGMIGAVALLIGGLVLGIAGPPLLAMLVVLARIGAPALQFQQNLQMLMHTLPTYERIKLLEEELPQVEGVIAGQSVVPLPHGAVCFRRVSYLHAGNGGVRELDLVLEPGSFVAIIGASAAGKTTLADLLAGLLVPQSGAIEIGGEPLTPRNSEQWRNAIAYVPQDSFLLNDTIRHNLLWGSAATEGELSEVLRIVAADAVVDSRSQGLASPVGERGILLSGGERQRLALARALLRRPRVIILDEATNALDPETEERIITRLATLPDRPTIVAISHRATMLDRFDRVYRMEGGRLG